MVVNDWVRGSRQSPMSRPLRSRCTDLLHRAGYDGDRDQRDRGGVQAAGAGRLGHRRDARHPRRQLRVAVSPFRSRRPLCIVGVYIVQQRKPRAHSRIRSRTFCARAGRDLFVPRGQRDRSAPIEDLAVPRLLAFVRPARTVRPLGGGLPRLAIGDEPGQRELEQPRPGAIRVVHLGPHGRIDVGEVDAPGERPAERVRGRGGPELEVADVGREGVEAVELGFPSRTCRSGGERDQRTMWVA